MSRTWNYARLTSDAKLAGGPDAYVDSLVSAGVDYGKTSMIPWLGVMFVGGGLTWAACERIYEKYKENKKQKLEEEKRAAKNRIKAISSNAESKGN